MPSFNNIEDSCGVGAYGE
ncbi:hypothetical protein A2U01_0098117, partial [Trifolium medium]|nr:hypothetical protein [Trifolium medium]